MSKPDELIKVLAKVMDEEPKKESSETDRCYQCLLDSINRELPKVLDRGDYIENASIMQGLEKVLEQYEIFSVIPELIEKTAAVVMGKSSAIEELIKEIGVQTVKLSYNTNLPLFFMNGQQTNLEGIYAWTYIDKLIPLSQKEYKILTQEFYKEQIEIRKLIKAFVIYGNSPYSNLTWLFLPEYADFNCEIVNVLKETIQAYYLVIDLESRWKKMIRKLPEQMVELCLIADAAWTDFQEIPPFFKNRIRIEKRDSFSNLCSVLNKPCINFMIQTEIQNILLDIDVYYAKRRQALDRKIELLARDSLHLAESTVKEQVKKYRENFLKERARIIVCEQEFLEIKDQIQKAALEYENSFTKTWIYALSDCYFVSQYQDKLLQIYFKHIRARSYERAKEDILRLTRIGYPYASALESLIKWMQGGRLSKKEQTEIRNAPSENGEIAKIKIVMEKELGYKSEELKKFASNMDLCFFASGKEWYYLGKSQLDRKEFIPASESFRLSLALDYSKAGEELFWLAQNHPECQIKIEELAEHLVPAANYSIGCQALPTKKGIVNLRMAASKEYIDAVEKVAEIEFKKCQKIPWQKAEEKKNAHKIDNVIKFYLFLNQKESKTEYLLRVGLLYCKLKDYTKAYSYLKDLNTPEAFYECAKMLQYGNGVVKNLAAAKKYYEKIEGTYRDSDQQYQKVCEQLKQTKAKKQKTYSEKIDYSRGNYADQSSDFCFITTAACLALNQTKDCKELNLLRKFRDTYILQDKKDGELLIKEYYRIAPILITYIDCEWNPFAVYTELWVDYILPSCQEIQLKNFETAKQYYIDMVRMLCKKYSVAVKEEIQERYQIIEMGNQIE